MTKLKFLAFALILGLFSGNAFSAEVKNTMNKDKDCMKTEKKANKDHKMCGKTKDEASKGMSK